MAKGRMLNKKIVVDENFRKLSDESALLFTLLIAFQDKSGRFFAKPEMVKGYVMPYRESFTLKKIDNCLREIEANGLIEIYGKDRDYMEFKGFYKNNTPHPHEAESIIPCHDNVITKQLHCHDNVTVNGMELNGMEWNGIEGKAREVKAPAKIPAGPAPRTIFLNIYKEQYKQFFKTEPVITKADIFTLDRMIKLAKDELKTLFIPYFENAYQDKWREKHAYSLVAMEPSVKKYLFDKNRKDKK